MLAVGQLVVGHEDLCSRARSLAETNRQLSRRYSHRRESPIVLRGPKQCVAAHSNRAGRDDFLRQGKLFGGHLVALVDSERPDLRAGGDGAGVN